LFCATQWYILLGSMKRLFVESSGFKAAIDKLNQRGLLETIQSEILANPECGDVVQGSGGIRKVRIANPARGKGKRGGFRVLFLDLPDREHTHLIWIYGKEVAEDIGPDEKKIFRQLVKSIRGEGR